MAEEGFGLSGKMAGSERALICHSMCKLGALLASVLANGVTTLLASIYVGLSTMLKLRRGVGNACRMNHIRGKVPRWSWGCFVLLSAIHES